MAERHWRVQDNSTGPRRREPSAFRHATHPTTMRRLSAVLALMTLACAKEPPKPAADSSTPTAGAAASTLGPGEAKLAADGGSIWYKRSGTGTATPVILLHGGPGLSSYYLKAL